MHSNLTFGYSRRLAVEADTHTRRVLISLAVIVWSQVAVELLMLV